MIESTTSSALSPYRQRGHSPAGWLLNLFSNVWLGIFWAVLIFFYCSIGSAIPAVRQHPSLEMTEFEWFHWWPFALLIVLFCTTMIVTTIRRIPLRPINAGVWTIHTGIVTLAIGSYYYFSTKVEGDVPVFRRSVKIQMPGLGEPETFVALPGSETRVVADSATWTFRVVSTNSSWPILSDEHKGENAYAVNVQVTPPSGDPFIRQLLAGYPQYTEDIIPGKGRAIKSIGRKLVAEDLELSLDYHATEYFHVMDTWALFVRKVGDTDWVERPIEGLGRYNDRVSSRDQVFRDPHEPFTLRPIDLAVPATAQNDPLEAASLNITGYLRYARLQREWGDGGERLNPILQLQLVSSGARSESYELAAFDRVRNQAADGNIQFVWLEKASQRAELANDSRAILHVSVPNTEVSFDVVITPEVLGAPLTPIEGTEFAYRVTNVHDRLTLPGRDRPVSLAVVEIKTPTETFRRWVADLPEHTKDLRDGGDVHSVEAAEPDPRIEMTYHPQSAPIIFAGYPGGLHFVFNGPNGRVLEREVSPGETIEVIEGLSLRVEAYLTHGVAKVKPFIVPKSSRQRDVGVTFAMVRVEIDTGRDVQTRWVPFQRYVFPNETYTYGGRFAYAPERFRGANGVPVEVVFSRRRVKLPHPIAMEAFHLDTHLGGYSGSTSTIRNYVSELRFLDGGQWTETVPIKVNQPAEYGGFWYFQSMWDRPPASNPTGGMNYTGLGVGNRHGVHIQLAGCCLAVSGMLFAFYVKPVMKRRAHERSRRKLSESERATEDSAQAFADEAARPVKV